MVATTERLLKSRKNTDMSQRHRRKGSDFLLSRNVEFFNHSKQFLENITTISYFEWIFSTFPQDQKSELLGQEAYISGVFNICTCLCFFDVLRHWPWLCWTPFSKPGRTGQTGMAAGRYGAIVLLAHKHKGKGNVWEAKLFVQLWRHVMQLQSYQGEFQECCSAVFHPSWAEPR